MADTDIPEPDRAEGAPHPRMTPVLFGHDAAEAAVLGAIAADRLHHAWLLTGPRGVGKATFAWRVARVLAATPVAAGGGLFDDVPATPQSLDMGPDHPVWRRAAALAEPGIVFCRRAWDDKAKRLKTQLTVDEIRRLRSQFALSAADGGRRVAVIDAADEMNAAAANALLKLLEEPPEHTTFLLVCHQPARLLPTVRSRCRRLSFGPLSAEDLARALQAADQPLDDLDFLHALGGGSVGEAVRLIAGEGPAVYPEILDLIGAQVSRPAVARLAASAAGRTNEARYDMILRLTGMALARLARAALGAEDLLPVERALAARLPGGPSAAQAWATVQGAVTERAGRARALNLDPEQVILDMFLAIETTASRIGRAA